MVVYCIACIVVTDSGNFFVCVYGCLNASAGLLGGGNNVLELGAETNDGVTEHTRVNLETLVELANHSWVCVKLH